MKDYKRLEAEMMYWRASYNYLRERMEYLLDGNNELDSMSDIKEILENIEEFTDLDVLEGFDGTQEYIDKCVKNKVLKKQKEREDYDRGEDYGRYLGKHDINLLDTQDVQTMQEIQKILEDKESPYNKGFIRGYKYSVYQRKNAKEKMQKKKSSNPNCQGKEDRF